MIKGFGFECQYCNCCFYRTHGLTMYCCYPYYFSPLFVKIINENSLQIAFCSCTEESILDSLYCVTLDFKNESFGFKIFVVLQKTFFFNCLQEKEDFALRQKVVKTLLNDHGQALVHALINACIFCLPTFMTTDFGEVIFELMKIDRPVCTCTCISY